MPSTSHSLLDRLRDRGDPRAWRCLVEVYEPWLRGWLSRHDLQPADVEDVLQDILLVVSQKLPKFEHNGNRSAFRKWLRNILANQVRAFLRQHRPQQLPVAPSDHVDWLDQLEDSESPLAQEWEREHDRQLVRRTLAHLQPEFNPATWEVFRLLILEDEPVATVAERLGITANAIYVAKSRVLARLRVELRGLSDF